MVKKRIIFLTRLNPKKFGSYEEFLLLFSKELIKRGNEVTLTFSSTPPAWLMARFAEQMIGIKVFNFHRKMRVVFEMFFFLKRTKPDILFFSFISIKHLIIPLTKILRIPSTIYVFHSYGSEKWKGPKEKHRINLMKVKIGHLRTLIAVKSVHKFICVSRFIKEKVSNKYSISEEKISVIHNGVNLRRFNRVEQDLTLHNQLKGPGNARVITSIANLILPKGIQFLLIAFKEILIKNANIKLVIAGEGNYRQNLEGLAKSLDISENVIFLGLRNDIHRIIHLSDIVVIPSICEEAFCYVVLESMCVGKPVIASRIGAIPELIQEDKTGLFCKPGDSKSLYDEILSLLCNPDKMKEIGHSAREYAHKNGSLEKQIDSYLNLLQMS